MSVNKIYLFLAIFISLFFTGCLTNDATPYQYSTLHEAVRFNQVDIVESIIKDNPDIHKKDNFGETPLVDAVRYNYTKIAKLLICYGADKNISNVEKISLEKMAIKNNNYEIFNMLQGNTQIVCADIYQIYSTLLDNNKTTDTILLDVNGTNIETIEVNSSIAFEETDESKYINNEDIDNELETKDDENLFENYETEEDTHIDDEIRQLNKLQMEDFSEEELNEYINETDIVDMDSL